MQECKSRTEDFFLLELWMRKRARPPFLVFSPSFYFSVLFFLCSICHDTFFLLLSLFIHIFGDSFFSDEYSKSLYFLSDSPP